MPGNGRPVRKGRRRLILGAAVAIVVLAAFGVTSLRSNAAIDPSKLAAAERGTIARAVVATGKVQPQVKVEVKSKASGIVKHVLADYGDSVKTGQVLVELDKEELQARVREAGAAVLGAQAALERTEVEAQGPDIPFLRSGMERARKLFGEGLIADS